MTMMRIQSQIDTVILSLGSADSTARGPVLARVLTPRAAPFALGRALLSGFDLQHRAETLTTAGLFRLM